DGLLEKTGGEAGLGELVALTSATANVATHAALVVEASHNRGWAELAARISNEARNGGLTPEARELLAQRLAVQAAAERPRLQPGGDTILDTPTRLPAVWGQGDRIAWAQGEG